MEVDLSWLEPEETKPPSKRASRPPPERRETMEVHLEWLEEAPREPEPAKKTRTSLPPQRRSSTATVPATATDKRARKPWEPPTLPPPHANAVKTKRMVPPPLPREEPEDPPRKRPSKAPKR